MAQDPSDKIIVSGDLSYPPSEVYTFRTFVFCAKRLCGYTVLVEVPWEYRDTYWAWFKNNWLFDHVDDFIDITAAEPGKRLSVDRMTCENLNHCLASIGFSISNDRNKNRR